MSTYTVTYGLGTSGSNVTTQYTLNVTNSQYKYPKKQQSFSKNLYLSHSKYFKMSKNLTKLEKIAILSLADRVSKVLYESKYPAKPGD